MQVGRLGEIGELQEAGSAVEHRGVKEVIQWAGCSTPLLLIIGGVRTSWEYIHLEYVHKHMHKQTLKHTRMAVPPSLLSPPT